jgi:hypothetical protein
MKRHFCANEGRIFDPTNIFKLAETACLFLEGRPRESLTTSWTKKKYERFQTDSDTEIIECENLRARFNSNGVPGMQEQRMKLDM